MYVYHPPALHELLSVWEREGEFSSTIDHGNSVESIMETINQKQGIILIYPWEFLSEKGSYAYNIVNYQKENPGICYVFGGETEKRMLQPIPVNTQMLSKESYLHAIKIVGESQQKIGLIIQD